MQAAIYKFPFPLVPFSTVTVYAGAKILCAMAPAAGESVGHLYAIVNPELPKYEIRLRIFTTGAIPGEDDLTHYEYISTIQVGALVFHVFRLIDK